MPIQILWHILLGEKLRIGIDRDRKKKLTLVRRDGALCDLAVIFGAVSRDKMEWWHHLLTQKAYCKVSGSSMVPGGFKRICKYKYQSTTLLLHFRSCKVKGFICNLNFVTPHIHFSSLIVLYFCSEALCFATSSNVLLTPLMHLIVSILFPSHLKLWTVFFAYIYDMQHPQPCC